MNSLIKNVHNAENSGMNIYKDKHGTKYYEITFQQIEDNLGLNRYHQKQDIIKGIEELMQTLITFNVFGRDKVFKGVVRPTFKDVAKTTLLSFTKYREYFEQEEERKSDGNKIYYSFTPMLLEAIISPVPYGKLNFDEQNKIKSKYSLALWEMLKTEIDTQKKQICKTQIMTIEDYQTLIAGQNIVYKDFYRINEKLIKKPLLEVNQITNTGWKVKLHKTGRKTSHVQFEAQVDEIQNVDRNRANITERLSYHIKNRKTLLDILDKYQDDEYILANLKVSLNSTTKNFIGFLKTALRDNYAKFTKQRDLFDLDTIDSQKKNTRNDINKILIQEKISEKKRQDILDKYQDDEYILANLKNAKDYANKMKQEVSPPLIISAIEDNYANFTTEIKHDNEQEKVEGENTPKVQILLNDTLKNINNDMYNKIRSQFGENLYNAWFDEKVKIVFLSENLRENIIWFESEKIKNIILLNYQAKLERVIDGIVYKLKDKEINLRYKNLKQIVGEEYYSLQNAI